LEWGAKVKYRKTPRAVPIRRKTLENTRMFANSSLVRSDQVQVHPRLAEVVARHLHQTFRRTPSEAGRRAFDNIVECLRRAPFVLDAGCGTGTSTFVLALRHPDRIVLGVDKSAARLAAGLRRIEAGEAPRNARLLRCDLVDFWQLAAAAGLRCEHQYLLYPNPWPKPDQFKRRWHAHPVLRDILKLGGSIEMCTNWGVYADEFAAVFGMIGRSVEHAPLIVAADPLTLFERKYAASGHALWRVIARGADGSQVP